MEDEVDAVVFLWGWDVPLVCGLSSAAVGEVGVWFVLTFAAKAIHRLASRFLGVMVVIMQNLQRSMKAVRSCTFSGSVGSSRFLPV